MLALAAAIVFLNYEFFLCIKLGTHSTTEVKPSQPQPLIFRIMLVLEDWHTYILMGSGSQNEIVIYIYIYI